nr:endonuclease VII domain-containing protein [Streptomyces mashuensis]
MIMAQGGVCCICLSARPVHVDHCHATDKVRGVLCFSCNAALGQFKDRPDALRRAADYLEGNMRGSQPS